jgi:hypothetical protein
MISPRRKPMDSRLILGINMYKPPKKRPSGWWCNNHLEKYESQIGMIVPIYEMEK